MPPRAKLATATRQDLTKDRLQEVKKMDVQLAQALVDDLDAMGKSAAPARSLELAGTLLTPAGQRQSKPPRASQRQSSSLGPPHLIFGEGADG